MIRMLSNKQKFIVIFNCTSNERSSHLDQGFLPHGSGSRVMVRCSNTLIEHIYSRVCAECAIVFPVVVTLVLSWEVSMSVVCL
jgi:hypothetical protein